MKSRSFLTIAILGAMIIAAAVPALAFENEFHGYYQVQPIFSNFNGSTTTDGFYTPEGLDKDAPSANYVEQRVRLAYTGKANDNLKLVTKFEFDYAYWGNSSYGVARNGGGALGSDEVNLETKHLYLDVNLPSTPLNAKIGMQGFEDRFEGVFFSGDAAGILLSAPFGNVSTALGFFRLYDNSKNTVRGKETADLFALDIGVKIDGLNIGGAYYYVNDNRDTTDLKLNTLGVSGEAVVGPATFNAFLLYQFGDLSPSSKIKAFVGNAGAVVKAGPGSARAEVIYASGDNNADDDNIKSLQTISGEYGYYSNHLVIIGRDEYAMTTDNAIVYEVGNGGQGSMIASAGYDLPLGKATLSATLGGAWISKDQGNHDGTFLGTEINAGLSYPLFDNLTAVVRGAYMVLGNYFNGVAAGGDDPANPYDARVILVYSF